MPAYFQAHLLAFSLVSPPACLLPNCQPTRLFASPPACLLTFQPTRLSAYLSAHPLGSSLLNPPACLLPVYALASLSACLLTCQPTRLPAYLPAHPPACLLASLRLPVCLSNWSTCISLSSLTGLSSLITKQLARVPISYMWQCCQPHAVNITITTTIIMTITMYYS